jgi:hypothetical protein
MLQINHKNQFFREFCEIVQFKWVYGKSKQKSRKPKRKMFWFGYRPQFFKSRKSKQKKRKFKQKSRKPKHNLENPSLEAFQENRYQFEGVHFELVIDIFCSQNLFIMHF